MSLARFALIVSLTTVLTGCLQSATLVKVKPDGSGTIEQTMLVNLATFKGLMAGMGGQTKDMGPGVLNEADFKRAAERMGVTPVSLTPAKEGPFEGAKAIFSFTDITKVRVDQDPNLSGSTPGAMAAPPTGTSPIRFGLARQGGASTLTITFDEKQADAAAAKMPAGSGPAGADMDPAMLQMIKTMFQGFKIGIDLEVEGTILKTNADYVNGSRITLLEVDVAGLFEDEAKLKGLQSKIGPGASISALRPYLNDLKGVKINNPSIAVEFR
jgi:hypothetical protein